MAMADTVAIDLNGAGSLRTSERDCANDTFATKDSFYSINAADVVAWMANAEVGTWYGAPANGHTGTTVWATDCGVTAAGENDVTVAFFNRKAYAGSIVGTVLDLGDIYTDICALTLSVDGSSLGSTDTTPLTVAIVYNTGNAWTMAPLTGAANTWVDSTQTLSVDLSTASLSSQSIYLIASSEGQTTSAASAASSAGIKTLGFSLSAQTIPEPATASLSLLALAGLAARRRRK